MSNYKIELVVETFNNNLKKLINIIENIEYDAILMDTIKRKIFLVLEADPLILIKELGPHIFIFRDYITNGLDELINDYEKIMKNNTSIINKLKMLNNNLDNSKIHDILKSLKLTWNDYSNSEKKKIRNIFSILLSEYCKYLTIKS